MQSLGIKLKQ